MTICRSIRCPAELKQLAEESATYGYSPSPPFTSKFVLNITTTLTTGLRRNTRHGVLVDVYGVGILINGEAAAIKSGAALLNW